MIRYRDLAIQVMEEEIEAPLLTSRQEAQPEEDLQAGLLVESDLKKQIRRNFESRDSVK